MLSKLFVMAMMAVSVQAFVQQGRSTRSVIIPRSHSALSMKGEQYDLPRSLSKDGIIKSLSKVAVATALACSTMVTTGIPSSNAADNAIVVLGSGGKTGKLVVDYLNKKGVEVTPTSYRTGTDVTKIETLESSLKGSKAVIFAASASKSGGKADAVDYKGLENVAKECVRLKVPRLVVISSGAITRPDSLGFKFTNVFGRIMEYKLMGENALKDVYKNADSSLTYAIVRPGGLSDGKPVGPGHIELNQGDSISGEVNRSDVAEVAAEAALSKVIPKDVTFEMYEVGKSGPLEGKFEKLSGYEQNGEILGASTYDALFQGLKSGEVVVLGKK